MSDALDRAINDNGRLSREWIDNLLGPNHELSEHTIQRIQGSVYIDDSDELMANRDIRDIRCWLETAKIKVYGQHPHEESAITGPVRGFLFNDEFENLEPLSNKEKCAVDMVYEALKRSMERSSGQ